MCPWVYNVQKEGTRAEQAGEIGGNYERQERYIHRLLPIKGGRMSSKNDANQTGSISELSPSSNEFAEYLEKPADDVWLVTRWIGKLERWKSVGKIILLAAPNQIGGYVK